MPLSVKRPGALSQSPPTPERRPTKKRAAQSDCRQHSIAPAALANTMPEQTRSATAHRASKPSSTESVFPSSPQSSAATDSPSPTLQSSAVTGSVRLTSFSLTAQQASHFPSRQEIMKMSNAETRALLIKFGFNPGTSIIELIPNSC